MFFGHIYLDIAISVILLSRETGGDAGKTSTKAEHNAMPKKWKEVGYHSPTLYSKNRTQWSHNIKKVTPLGEKIKMSAFLVKTYLSTLIPMIIRHIGN